MNVSFCSISTIPVLTSIPDLLILRLRLPIFGTRIFLAVLILNMTFVKTEALLYERGANGATLQIFPLNYYPGVFGITDYEVALSDIHFST